MLEFSFSLVPTGSKSREKTSNSPPKGTGYSFIYFIHYSCIDSQFFDSVAHSAGLGALWHAGGLSCSSTAFGLKQPYE